jgi:LmbE family N-acetylglucosaminyl deacetylase
VVAAHPDDEVLGCGATIAKHTLAGHEVHVVICSPGIASRYGEGENNQQNKDQLALKESATRANDVLGVSSLKILEFPDNRMDSVDLLDIVKCIEKHIGLVRPDTVFTHHAADLNIDHRRVHEAVATACRPVTGQSVRNLLFFEIPSSTEWASSGHFHFQPTVYIDVSATIDTKIRALQAYASEMRPWPHPRSLKAIEHLARWRGSNAGFDAAEAFVMGRLLLD